MIYKFRAECMEDITSLLALIPKEKLIKHTYFPLASELNSKIVLLGDIESSIELRDLTLEELKSIMRRVEDGYVMVQTVANTDDYTGERNYEESL